MGFRNNTYAKIWKVDNKGNYSTCSMTISKKDKESGEYKTDFQDGFVRLVGQAHEFVSGKDIPEKGGLGVRIGDCDVSRRYDSEKNTTYTNFTVFSFKEDDDDSANNKKTKNTTKAKPKAVNAPANDDDEPLPWE